MAAAPSYSRGNAGWLASSQTSMHYHYEGQLQINDRNPSFSHRSKKIPRQHMHIPGADNEVRLVVLYQSSEFLIEFSSR